MTAGPYDSLLVQFRAPGGGEAWTVPCPRDLRFDRETPGGFKSLSCSLVLPAGTATPRALSTLAQVRVVDRRTGAVVWFGELTDPGLTVQADGQHYAITAQGAQSRLDGWREVYGLVDRSQDSWQGVGDFQGSSASFSGDLSPDGDYDVGDIDLGDLVDVNPDELGIDFGGDLDLGNIDLGDGGLGDPFGGDLGDFNNIDFTGGDYPKPADYPGYLGWLQDPTGGAGDMLPIPFGPFDEDGPWWADWEEGWTSTGGSATGTTAGIITPGSVPPGQVARRHRSTIAPIGGLMQTPGIWAPGSAFRTQGYDSGAKVIYAIAVGVELSGPGAEARLWFWADPTLNSDGISARMTLGSLSLVLTAGGVDTVLSTTSWSGSAGVTYNLAVDAGGSVVGVVVSGSGDFVYEPVVGAGIFNSANTVSFAGSTYQFAPTAPGVTVYNATNPLPAQQTDAMFKDDRYWGIAGAGTGTVTFHTVNVSFRS